MFLFGFPLKKVVILTMVRADEFYKQAEELKLLVKECGESL